MDLKFSFDGGRQEEHTHDDGGSTVIPLPFSTAPASTSSVLDIELRRDADLLVAEAVSGDGVTYARAEIDAPDDDAEALARAARSAVSRAVAGLEGPLSEAVTAIKIALGPSGGAVLAALSFEGADGEARTDDAFQRRTGIVSGTPVVLL